MTQIAIWYPLEKLQPYLRIWWQLVTLSLLPYRRRLRAVWLAAQGREAYRVARYIPDEESIDWQCRMAAALGGSDRALIVAQFIRWIDFNKSEGRDATTHNGYDAWIMKHFWHLKPGAFGGHIRALEKMGVLKTQRIGEIDPLRKYDQRKSYKIDRGRLNALIAAVKKPNPDTDEAKSKSKTRNPSLNSADPSLNNESNRVNQFSNQSLNPNLSTQEKPTNPGRGGRRAGAGRKPKQKEALTEPTASTAAPSDQTSVEVIPATTPDQDSPSPVPPPPSHPEAALIERLMTQGMDEGKAVALIDAYDADRVRAVVSECERRQKSERGKKIENPPGWIIAELKNDVFKLGSIPDAECDESLREGTAAIDEPEGYGPIALAAWRAEQAARAENTPDKPDPQA